MSNQIIIQAKEIFNTFPKWNAFLELTRRKELIMREWIERFLEELEERDGFISLAPANKWAWHIEGNRQTVGWYLKEMGPFTMGIGMNLISSKFGLLLSGDEPDWLQDAQKIVESLKKDKYSGLRLSVPGKPQGYWWPWAEDDPFFYNGTRLDREQSIWVYMHNPEIVFEQIQAKLAALFKQTELFVELNEETRKQK